MIEDDRGILNGSYDSIPINGESLGMGLPACHKPPMTGNVFLASICGDVGDGF